MKYTNYILGNKVINIEALETKNPVLMLPMMVVGVPIVLLGTILIVTSLPAAATMDEIRKIKYFLIRFERINNYQYGSQTHISNLYRDHISIPYRIYMGHNTRRAWATWQPQGGNWLSWIYYRDHLGRLLPYMGWVFLVVNIFK